MGCGGAVIYLFASVAPFIGINFIGLSPELYGLLNFIPPIGMILGSFLGQRWSHKWESLQIIHLGSGIVAIIAFLMFLSFLCGFINTITLFCLMPFLYIGFALAYSNASGLAMGHCQDKSNASAVMHFLNMGFAVVSLFIFELFHFQKPVFLPLTFVVIGSAMLCFYYRLKKELTKLG